MILDWTEILKNAGIPEPPWEDKTKHQAADIELEADDEDKDNWMQL